MRLMTRTDSGVFRLISSSLVDGEGVLSLSLFENFFRLKKVYAGRSKCRKDI